MTLNASPNVAQCVVCEENDGALRIYVVPAKSTVDLTDQGVLSLLKKRGLADDVQVAGVTMVPHLEDLPQATHKRVVLLDLLKILFEEADINNDGVVSRFEFCAFVGRHSLPLNSRQSPDIFKEACEEVQGGLPFEQFKTVLMSLNWVGLQDNTGDGVMKDFFLHEKLMPAVAGHFFAKADSDGGGDICRAEVASVYRDYGLGTEEVASQAFAKTARINREEFSRVLLKTNIISHTQKHAVDSTPMWTHVADTPF